MTQFTVIETKMIEIAFACDPVKLYLCVRRERVGCSSRVFSFSDRPLNFYGPVYCGQIRIIDLIVGIDFLGRYWECSISISM